VFCLLLSVCVCFLLPLDWRNKDNHNYCFFPIKSATYHTGTGSGPWYSSALELGHINLAKGRRYRA